MTHLLVIGILGLLILVHEAGHFWAARRVGIPVARFSIGFGPRLWGITRGQTEYWLSLVPLGGYVLPAVEDERAYLTIPVGRRLVFALGGPAANFLLAVVLFAVLNVADGTVSAAGSPGSALYAIFIAPLQQTVNLTVRVLEILPAIFLHPTKLSGIVGIVSDGGRIVSGGGVALIKFGIMMSINLGVFNLLPIPALDGGKIVLHLLEKLHPRATRLFVPLSVVGFVFLIGLMVFATVMDIGRAVS